MNPKPLITSTDLPNLRKTKKLSQAALGAILGLEKHHVSKIETNTRALSPAEQKLLRLYFFGEIPFELVHKTPDLATTLSFLPAEWRIIEILALSAGVTPAGWIRQQILGYLDHSPRGLAAAREAKLGKKKLELVPDPAKDQNTKKA